VRVRFPGRLLFPAALATALLVVEPIGMQTMVPAGASSSGPSWSGSAAPLPANAKASPQVTIYGTDCPSPGNCVAVGQYDDSAGFPDPLIEMLSGGTWTTVQAPLPANTGTDSDHNELAALNGVSCPTPTSCVAVGSYRDDDGPFEGYDYGLIETLSNGTWSARAAPQPPNSGTDADTYQSTDLDAVDCVAPGACTAVGRYADTNGDGWGLIDVLSGGSWSATEAPQPPNSGNDTLNNQDTSLGGLSCPTAGFCTLVGSYMDDSPSPPGHQFGLIETGWGSTWAPTEAPEPANTATDATDQFANLFNVSCSSDGHCASVGFYTIDSPSGYEDGLIETLDSGVWTPTEAPEPPGAAPAGLSGVFGVSCPADGVCTAVGRYEDAENRTWGLIETLAGGSWTPAQAPEPADGDTNPSDLPRALLSSISCSWPGECVAAGNYTDTAIHGQALIDTLSGGSWTATEGIVPVNAAANPKAALETTSCAAAFCAVAGTYASAGATFGVLDTFQGAGGYDLVASDGGLFAYGSPFLGSMGGKPLNAPVVGIAVDPATDGYWEVASDGGLFAFGAPFYGSMGGKPLDKPVVGMAFDSLTGGYYEVASDGGLFAFNAPFYGSMGGKPLNEPIVGIAFDPLTGGYYEVASDGGLFAFNAPYLGSMGGTPLNKPVVGMTVDTTTGGYYEVASDGGLFAFGAPFRGSMGGTPLNKPVVGMAFDSRTNGYYEVATDGGLFAFGTPFLGSTGSMTLDKPVVGMGVT
jgi:hypothetical protein